MKIVVTIWHVRYPRNVFTWRREFRETSCWLFTSFSLLLSLSSVIRHYENDQLVRDHNSRWRYNYLYKYFITEYSDYSTLSAFIESKYYCRYCCWRCSGSYAICSMPKPRSIATWRWFVGDWTKSPKQVQSLKVHILVHVGITLKLSKHIVHII